MGQHSRNDDEDPRAPSTQPPVPTRYFRSPAPASLKPPPHPSSRRSARRSRAHVATFAVIGRLLSFTSRTRCLRSLAIAVAALCLLNAAATGRTPISPDPTLVRAPLLSNEGGQTAQAVQRSVVKVHGVAHQCDQLIEGSGFVYETGRVITNAHVVAGTDAVTIETTQGALPATVIFYDPNEDVAVLNVPDLRAEPLAFAPAARTGDDAIVLGYPNDGSYTATPAIIRGREAFTGPNIYGAPASPRAVYAIAGTVQNGSSGGPLITPDGRVLGVVFAMALDSPDTGFVLTNDEIHDDIESATHASLDPPELITGGCSGAGH
jgi:S1-C subfamily serine protease